MSDEVDDFEEAEIDEEQEKIIKLDLVEQTNLSDLTVNDETLTKARPFSALKLSDKPIVPLPPDPCPDIFYPSSTVELKCSICMSPWRTRVEHQFIGLGQRPYRVATFFLKHFNVRLTFESIATHMANHCDLSKISQDGKLSYDPRDSIGPWIGREDELALTALIDQLFELRSITCKSADAKFRRASEISKIAKNIAQVKKDIDLKGHGDINFFAVLMDIHGQLKCEEDIAIVRGVIKKLREQIIKGSKDDQ